MEPAWSSSCAKPCAGHLDEPEPEDPPVGERRVSEVVRDLPVLSLSDDGELGQLEFFVSDASSLSSNVSKEDRVSNVNSGCDPDCSSF